MARPSLERPFWLDTVEAPTVGAPVALPPNVDVAIIGAGFTGLSAALSLAKRGRSVAVLERYHAGWGASSRNGGMALTGMKAPVDALLAKFGPENARLLYEASIAAIGYVERVAREESIDCDFVESGHIEAACKPSHFEAFRRQAETLAKHFNHNVRIVEKADLGTELGSHSYHGGLVDEQSAGLNPAKFARGLARRAAAAGATIAEEAPVEQVEKTGRNGARVFRLATPRGNMHAGDVLVATGAYTGLVTPDLRRRVIPVGSYVIATEPLGEATARRLIPRGRMVFDSNNFLHYYRLTPDWRMLFGGRAAFMPETERTVRESAELLRAGMVGVFPQLSDAAIEYAWGGSIDFTFDMLPHAGVIDGLHYALGYAGHGVAMATYLGNQMAGVIAGGARDVLPSGPLPAAPFGLYNGSPWFLPFAGAWYKFLDWAS